MYVYCVYPAMLKSRKQLPNCLKRAETIIVLIVFNGVLCEVCFRFLPLLNMNQVPAELCIGQ